MKNGKASLLSTKLHSISDKVWKVALFGPDNFKSAVISHYVRTGNKKLKRPAFDFALDLIEEYSANGEDIKIEESALQYLIGFEQKVPFPKPANPKFTFIDLFAGIGGFRLAMQKLGGECVFSSEWDKMAQRTYYANFGEIPFGDITKEETKEWIPAKFDVLCAGFPCQPFSIAGVSKKNSLGRKHGFEDEKQGNLFFHIAEIIEEHRPKAFFLENVKNLVSHDKGNTFKVIETTLRELGYSFHFKVLSGKHFVPQNRERTFMVGFDTKVFKNKEQFEFPKLPKPTKTIKEILEPKVDPKYTLTDHLWKYLQDYSIKHKAKGNGFGFGLVDLNGIARTMSARYYKDGSEILIPQEGKNPRRLSVREAARLQGYPDKFIVDAVSMNQGYKQFGNSVVVPLIQAIGNQIVCELDVRRKLK
jgi:DNA (cytosine-5)-methyltransferase 1